MVRPSGAARGVIVSVVLGLLVVGTVAPGAASSPPKPLCTACSDDSTVVVHVHDDGSATWVVTSNRSGDVVTDRKRDPEFAERAVGGTLRSVAFTSSFGSQNIGGIGAKRLTVVAPDGMRFGSTTPGSTVSDDDRRMTLTSLSDEQKGHVVTFVPQDSTAGPVLNLLAIGTLFVPVVLRNTFLYLVAPCTLFALLVGGVTVVLSRRTDRLERVRDSGGLALVALGLLATVHPLYLGFLAVGFVAPLFGLGVAAIAFGGVLSLPGIRERVSYRALVVGAVLAPLVAGGASALGSLAFGGGTATSQAGASFTVGVSVFALLPAGYALGRRRLGLAVGTAVVGFAATLVSLTPFTSPTVGLGFLLVAAAALYAVVLAVLGIPLIVAGASLTPPKSNPPTSGGRSAEPASLGDPRSGGRDL